MMTKRHAVVLAREIVILGFLFLAYDRIAALVDVHIFEALNRGAWILHEEQRFHVNVELTLNHALAGVHWLVDAMSVYYDFAHAFVTIAVLIIVYRWSRADYGRLRTAFVVINVAAFIIFAFLPVAPPRFITSAGFHDLVANSHTFGSWESSSSLARNHANEYGSFPSLHVAWAVWVMLSLWTVTKRKAVRAFGIAHVALTVSIVIITGNHYVVDVLVGAALSAVAFGVCTSFVRNHIELPARTGESLGVSS